MTTDEKVKALEMKHPDWDDRRISKSLRIGIREVREARGKIASRNGAVAKRGKTLQDFRSEFDKSFIVPKRIKAALKEMGPNGWEYEKPFSDMAGVTLSDLGNFRDQFADYIVDIRRVSKRAWAGSVGTAKQMREML